MRHVSISVQHLTKSFSGGKVMANDDLTFDVYEGELFGLLGPNGAGKTTLVLQLLGLVQPTSGAITVEGVDVIAKPEQVRSLMGFLPQSGIPMRSISVERALHYTGRLRGQSEIDAKRQSAALIEDLGLVENAKRDVNKLSGGVVRLVNFGMALMGEPRLLILDEPTNELDPRNRRVVWDMLADLNKSRGVTCILVTHNVLEAEQVVQRVGVMRHGKFVALGTPGEIKASLGGMVRLEFRLKDGQAEIDADAFPQLGRVEQIGAGEYRLSLPPDAVGTGVDVVLRQIGLDRIDDFRIAPLSLEDAYLALEHAAYS